MAKYSTGGSGGDSDADACELCGQATDDLRRATVAGAELLVCRSCAPHADTGGGGRDGGGGQDEGQDTGRSRESTTTPTGGTSGTSELWDRDSSRWEEEGTDYDSDQLPYLVSGYGELVTEARQEAGLQVEELADELGIDEDDILAVEQGRAARANVGGSVIADLEAFLGVDLAE